MNEKSIDILISMFYALGGSWPPLGTPGAVLAALWLPLATLWGTLSRF